VIWLLAGEEDDGAGASSPDAGAETDAGPRIAPFDGQDSGTPQPVGPAYGIRGLVQDDAGRTVTAAHVRITPDGRDGVFGGDELAPVEIATGPGGTFEVTDLPEGRFVVLAWHDRHPIGGFAGPISIPRDEVHDVLVVLGSAAAIRGVVHDREEAPIRGASVRADEATAAETDARGEFLLPALDPRRGATLVAGAEGYASVTEAVRLRAGEASVVEIVLSAGRSLDGRVVDDGRRPVAAARVTVVGQADARTDTDENGEFRFESVPREDLVLRAFHPEFTDSAPTPVGPDERRVELVLRRASSVSGTVYSPDGSAVMGVRVSLLATAGLAAEERAESPPRQTISNAEGVYRLGQVVEGTYSVVARSRGEAGRVDGVTVRTGDDVQGIDLRLGGRITVVGRVVTQFVGQPVAGASVEARFPSAAMVRAGEAAAATTDDLGRFRLDEVPPDLMALRVRHAGHAPETFSVAAHQDLLDVGDLEIEPRQFGGVGMVLHEEAGAIRVQEVLEDLPAARSGLLAGDLVLEIDGDPVDGMTLEDAVGRIRGTEGETVRVLVRRTGRSEPFELSLVRETVDVPDNRRR